MKKKRDAEKDDQNFTHRLPQCPAGSLISQGSPGSAQISTESENSNFTSSTPIFSAANPLDIFVDAEISVLFPGSHRNLKHSSGGAFALERTAII